MHIRKRAFGAFIGVLSLTVGLAACGQASPSASSSGSPAASDSGGVAPAGGDIPDTQVYLLYQGSGFSIKYAEGWVLTRTSSGVNFQDKDNKITLTISSGGTPTTAGVTSQVGSISGARVTTAAHVLNNSAGSNVAITYQVDGAADPVTGKRPHLSVDRYELARSGKVAVLELASPIGADNVDAYRMIAESFRWQ